MWISVEERLPEEPGDYLIFVPATTECEGFVAIVNYDNGVFDCSPVSHWQSPPEPPQ